MSTEKMINDYETGSPYSRGSLDKYYGRARKPHHYANWWGQQIEITKNFMTSKEIKEYNLGYDEQDDEKQW
jgi:hypothetical protein|tara:strand:+ start:436 stop:648 length:213 start_codon:yes stop_codon:yes gene_type:complete